MIGASRCPGVIGQSALRCLLDRLGWLWRALAGYHHGKKTYLGACTYTPYVLLQGGEAAGNSGSRDVPDAAGHT